MKKVLFLMLMCVCSKSIYGAFYEHYVMVGGRFSINIPAKGYYGYANIYNSDENVVEIVTSATQNSSEYDASYSYSLLLIGKSVGTANIKISYSYHPKKREATVNMDEDTYMIHVIDVTNISMQDNILLSCGETYSFSPIIDHPNVVTTLTWRSSNPAVATVDSTGVLTTLGVGVTMITCTAYNGVSAQCLVTVNPVLVDKVALNESDVEMLVGERLQLEAEVVPYNATDRSMTWRSSNENVALVSESGKVVAVGTGFCQIKAMANDGSGKLASCFIEVRELINVPGDMNDDGKVTMTDAVKVIDIILEKQ